MFQIMSMHAMIMDDNSNNSQNTVKEEEYNFVIIDSDDSALKQKMSQIDGNDEYVNRQIQFLNHISNYEGYSLVNFLIHNQYSIVEILFDPRTNNVRQLRSFHRQSSDIYQKIWNNNGGIQVQFISLISYNEQDEKQEILQYYFVDSRNTIQILFPNYEFKVDRVKTVGLISE